MKLKLSSNHVLNVGVLVAGLAGSLLSMAKHSKEQDALKNELKEEILKDLLKDKN